MVPHPKFGKTSLLFVTSTMQKHQNYLYLRPKLLPILLLGKSFVNYEISGLKDLKISVRYVYRKHFHPNVEKRALLVVESKASYLPVLLQVILPHPNVGKNFSSHYM